MAITTEDNIRNLLKTYYKDGVENLMFRNSPVVKELTKERVEGKTQNFSTMVGRGGAVGANYKSASKAAASNASTAEFAVEPGQIFSVYTMNAKEVLASKTLKGAYAPVAGAKMFAASEALRKTIATAFYGSGYGELCQLGDGVTTISGDLDHPTAIKVPSHVIMGIDVGTILDITKDITKPDGKMVKVVSIEGNTINVSPCSDADGYPELAKAIDGLDATYWLCLHGSTKAGKPLLPVGLAGWLPTVDNRAADSGWQAYISTPFFNVNRSENPDRLAGAFFDGTGLNSKTPVKDAIEGLLLVCRRQGSQADLIVMNDNDFKRFAHEVPAYDTYMTATSTKAKRQATMGFDSFAASFSTNYIENIYDDPYCPEGKAYILDREYVRLWSYTNMDVENDGVVANNAGKPDVMEAGENGNAEKPYGLIIDDYLNIKPGQDTDDGPATMVSLMTYFSFVITNPSVCGVALLKK